MALRRGSRYLAALAAALAVLGSAGGVSPGLAQQPVAAGPACRSVQHEGAAYTICEADLARHTVRLFWQRPDGQPYGYLSALPRTLAPAGGKLLFAMNAGMFHPDYRPVGLYVEDGRQLSAANTRSGPGNFHMKPNGIFYVGAAGAGVLETAAYLKTRSEPQLATQSGPMLVIRGRLHPRFSRSGESLKVRNGVGVRDGRSAIFAISEEAVSFGAFARLFRDRLKCPDALFLDGGSAPALYAPDQQRGGNLLPLGPMVGVFEKVR